MYAHVQVNNAVVARVSCVLAHARRDDVPGLEYSSIGTRANVASLLRRRWTVFRQSNYSASRTSRTSRTQGREDARTQGLKD